MSSAGSRIAVHTSPSDSSKNLNVYEGVGNGALSFILPRSTLCDSWPPTVFLYSSRLASLNGNCESGVANSQTCTKGKQLPKLR